MESFVARPHRIAAAIVAGVLALAGCGTDKSGIVDGIHLVDANALTVCTHLPYKPFEFTRDGKVVGFDVDILKLLAHELGVKERVVSMDWNQITSGAVFASDKCDLAMGGATITSKRGQAVLFSDPYFNASQALLVENGSGIESLDDLHGKRLAIQADTTGAIYAEKHVGEYGYTIVVFDDLALETAAVSTGRVAAAIGDNAPLVEYAKDHPSTAAAAQFDTGERYGFMAKKNDANARKLIERLNRTIAEAQKNGAYDRIYRKRFGHQPAQGDR